MRHDLATRQPRPRVRARRHRRLPRRRPAARLAGAGQRASRPRPGAPRRSPRRRPQSRPSEAARRRAYEATRADAAAARQLRIPRETFRSWRLRRGLPTRWSQEGLRLSSREEVRRYSAYVVTGSDTAAAAAVGVRPHTFLRWRTSRGLSKKSAVSSVLPREELLRRRGAYRRAASDAEAARALGLQKTTFTAWRAAQDLPNKHRQGPDEERRRLAAYRRTGSDAAAGRALGMSRGSFKEWRRRRGRPNKHRPGPNEEKRRLAAYRRTGTDAAAARALGIMSPTFAAWRRARRLPSKNRPGPSEVKRRLAAHRKAGSDAEAARALGVPKTAFSSWRRRRGLRSKNLPGPSGERRRLAAHRRARGTRTPRGSPARRRRPSLRGAARRAAR